MERGTHQAMNTPTLLVYVPAYNHGQYIKQCLESIVSQKLNIPFSALVIDDCSTDDTADIIRTYAAAHPHIIRPVLREENFGLNQGQPPELDESAPTYLSICEGDDFWLDDHKLQKQVDFLETHPECSICFHPVRVFYEDGSRPETIFPTPEYRFHKDRLSLNDLFRRNFMQTNSVLYRWRYGAGREKLRDVMPHGILPGDWFVHMLHAEIGEIAFLNDTMAAYRRHADSLWSGAEGYPRFFLRNGLGILKFFHEMETRFKVDKLYTKVSQFINIIESYVKLGEAGHASAIIGSRDYRALLAAKGRAPSVLHFAAFLKGCYYYRYARRTDWMRTREPRRYQQILRQALVQCLLRRDDENFERLLTRHIDKTRQLGENKNSNI